MAEEATEAPAEDQTQQDTPNESGPESTEDRTPATQEPEIDYEKRYNDLRSEYDRVTPIVAALQGRHGPEAQAQALQQFGFDMDEEDEFEERPGEDPDDRVARLEQWKNDFEQQQQEQFFAQQEEEYLVGEIERLEKDAGREFSDEEVTLLARAAQASRLDNGEPDIAGAYELLTGVSKSARDQYVASKKAPKAPIGSPGEEQIDTSDDQKRQEALSRIMAAEMSSD